MTLYEVAPRGRQRPAQGALVQPALPQGRAARGDAGRALRGGRARRLRLAPARDERRRSTRCSRTRTRPASTPAGWCRSTRSSGRSRARPCGACSSISSQQVPDDARGPASPEVRQRLGVIGRAEALRRVHVAAPEDELDALNRFRSPAHLRLILEELFLFQLGLARRRHGLRRERKGTRLRRSRTRTREAVKRILPFPLTGAQKRVLREIADDMRSSAPHEPARPGRRRLGQDDGGAALHGRGRRETATRPRSWPPRRSWPSSTS